MVWYTCEPPDIVACFVESRVRYYRAIRIHGFEQRLKLPVQWLRRRMAEWRAVGFFAAHTLTLAAHRGKNNGPGYAAALMPGTPAGQDGNLRLDNLPGAEIRLLKPSFSGSVRHLSIVLGIIVVRVFPRLQALGGVPVVGLQSLPQVLEPDHHHYQQDKSAEEPDIQVKQRAGRLGFLLPLQGRGHILPNLSGERQWTWAVGYRFGQIHRVQQNRTCHEEEYSQRKPGQGGQHESPDTRTGLS